MSVDLDRMIRDADPARGLDVPVPDLGHVEPANTYYYLTAAPQLLELVARRLEPVQEGL